MSYGLYFPSPCLPSMANKFSHQSGSFHTHNFGLGLLKLNKFDISKVYSFDCFSHYTNFQHNFPYVCVCQLTMADCMQFDCFGDPLFVVRSTGLSTDFRLEQSVDQCGLPQTALTCRHIKTNTFNHSQVCLRRFTIDWRQ